MRSITQKACQNGDKVTQKFTAHNVGTNPCHNVVADIVVPTGLRLNKRDTANSQGGVTPNYNAGAFNPVSAKWVIGILAGQTVEEITLEFEVIDETKFAITDFIVEFLISSNCEENIEDNKVWLLIDKDCPVEVEPADCDNVKIVVS